MFSPSVCILFYFLFWFAKMGVPFANRTAVASLPTLALALKPATIKEIIEDFAKQCPHESLLECVQLIKGRTLRVVFPSTNMMEEIMSGGLSFRGHLIQFKTPSVYKWVTLLDLPYGIPEGEIKTALSKFGQAAHVRVESYMGLYTGTRHVKIQIKTAIPSRVVVAGYPCTVFYRGQVRSCFRCGHAGHEAKTCPQKVLTRSAVPKPTDTNHVEPPSGPSVVAMSTTPPTSPRTFAGVVSGHTSPKMPDLPSSDLVSPVTLLLPPSPTRSLVVGSPTMDTDVHTNKRPYSPVSPSEGTDTDESDRTRQRLDVQPPSAPSTLDDNVRDRSPHRVTETSNDSSSDSSGKSLMASNASVIDPPAATSVVKTELQLNPARSLDRRPLSTRYQEYCPHAPEYSAEEAAELVASMLEVERQLASSITYDNQEEIELQQDYDHLKLDHAIALRAYESFDPDDPEAVTPADDLKEADEALVDFEAAYPEAVLASDKSSEVPNVTELTSVVDTATSSVETETSTSVVISEPPPTPESPIIPDGQPLNTRRRSRHKSRSQSKELASCVRQRTTPTLPGGRKSRKSKQPPPDSPYTPLVTDSGYLVTDTPRGTSPSKPQRPDTGAAGAISPSPSSVNPSVE